MIFPDIGVPRSLHGGLGWVAVKGSSASTEFVPGHFQLAWREPCTGLKIQKIGRSLHHVPRIPVVTRIIYLGYTIYLCICIYEPPKHSGHRKHVWGRTLVFVFFYKHEVSDGTFQHSDTLFEVYAVPVHIHHSPLSFKWYPPNLPNTIFVRDGTFQIRRCTFHEPWVSEIAYLYMYTVHIYGHTHISTNLCTYMYYIAFHCIPFSFPFHSIRFYFSAEYSIT